MSVRYDRKPLDLSLYSLEPNVADFFKAATAIHDDHELKAHILRVQADAYRVRQNSPSLGGLTDTISRKVFPYPCIRLFSFIKCVSGPPPPLTEPETLA